jgi:hypothetical protein
VPLTKGHLLTSFATELRPLLPAVPLTAGHLPTSFSVYAGSFMCMSTGHMPLVGPRLPAVMLYEVHFTPPLRFSCVVLNATLFLAPLQSNDPAAVESRSVLTQPR